MQSLIEAQQIYRSFQSRLIPYRGALRLNRHATIEQDAAAHLARLDAENEAIRRLPKIERTRILSDIRRETHDRRRLAASHARSQLPLRDVRQAADEWRAFIDRQRRDVSRSMPDALTGLSPDGMVNLSLLRVQIGRALAVSSPARLLAVYGEALQRRDPRAHVECELIESMALSGPLATTEAGRPPAKELRELVDAAQTMRLPEPDEMLDFEGLVREAEALDGRADLLNILPAPVGDPDDAAAGEAAYAAEVEIMTRAGQASDLDDQAAYRAELAEVGE